MANKPITHQLISNPQSLISHWSLGVGWWRTLALGVVLTMGGVGVIISPYPAVSRFRFGLFMIGVATYVVTVTFVNSRRRFWAAFTGLAALGLAIAVMGLVGSRWMTHKLPVLAAIVTLLPRLPDAWLSLLGAPDRIHPNEVGGALILVLPALLGLFLWSGARFRPSVPVAAYVVALVAAATIVFYLGLSLARGALLALVLAMLWFLAQRNKWLGIVATLSCAGLIGGALRLLPRQFAHMLLFSDLLKPQWYVVPTRFDIWRHGIELLRESPWTGIGLGAFRPAFQARVADVPFHATVVIPHAHNIYLQAALDLGLPGAVAYIALLAGAAFAAYRTGRRLGTTPVAGVAYGIAAGLLAFSLYGLTDAIHVASRPVAIIWFVMGLGTATERALGTACLSGGAGGRGE